MGARILILGTNGLSNEIAKNLVLAGVGHVRIQDAGIVDKELLSAGGLFSISESQLGCNRAEALCSSLKDMNPSVDFVAETSDVGALDAELLSSYHYIIGTRGADAVREVAMCTAKVEADATAGKDADAEPAPKRQRGGGESGPAVTRSNGTHVICPMRHAHGAAATLPKFLAAGTMGLDGFCFFDLGMNTAVIEPPPPKDTDAAKPGASAVPPKQPVTEQALYPTVQMASSVEWEALTPRVPRLYYALQLLIAQAAQPAEPDADVQVADAAVLLPSDAPPSTVSLLRALLLHRARLLKTAGANAGAAKLLSDSYLATVAQSTLTELAPVTAIVGGMVASEVLKVISGKERPINNVLFFDGETCDGVVQRCGPSFDCPWGLDKGDHKPARSQKVA